MYKYELVFKAKIIFLTQNFILSLVILNWLFQRDQVQFTYWEMFLRYEFCVKKIILALNTNSYLYIEKANYTHLIVPMVIELDI